jgi:hypothetical protein
MSDLRALMVDTGVIAEQLVEEMFDAQASNNEILLGEFTSGDHTIQVQLKVTREPEEFMDDNS